MRFLQTKLNNQGFTLVEMLVIAPFIILFIGIVIVFIVTLTGDGLKAREKNIQAYEVQNALNAIEDDATFATGFLSSTATTTYKDGGVFNNKLFPLATPQGANDDTTEYTTSGSGPLLIAAPATTTNPFDAARALVYLDTPDASCSASTLVTNDPYQVLYAYFVRNNTLWRRTIMGSLATDSLCNGPAWQQASCTPADVASGSYASLCKSEDAELVDNVSNMTVQYYSDADGGTPIGSYNWTTEEYPASIKVTLTTSKQVAGKAVSFTGAMRAASVNIR